LVSNSEGLNVEAAGGRAPRAGLRPALGVVHDHIGSAEVAEGGHIASVPRGIDTAYYFDVLQRHRLLPEPDGLEGFGAVVVVVHTDDLPVAERVPGIQARGRCSARLTRRQDSADQPEQREENPDDEHDPVALPEGDDAQGDE
jgi:hypothetical protein